MDWRALFNSITTVFGWTPAFILLVFAVFGILSGIVNFFEIPLLRFVTLMLVGVGGIAGFVGMSAVSWKLKLAAKVQLYCLLAGILTLGYVIAVGANIDDKWIRISFTDWLDVYLFVSPLVFAIVHVFIILRNKRYR